MRLDVELTPEDRALIKEFLKSTKTADGQPALDLNALASMLLQDVALAVRRPGSWEGANMITVLTSHGYQI